MKKALLVLVIATAVGAAAWYLSRGGDDPPTVYGIVESRRVEIGSKVGGRISAVLAREGDIVEKDQPLVRFEIAELDARRQGLEARLAEARARLRQLQTGSRKEEVAQAEAAAAASAAQLSALEAGPRPQEIEQARSELHAAEAAAANAAAAFARAEKLAASGDFSRQTFDNARTARDEANARREAARQRVKLLEAGTRPEDLAAARARARQAQQAAALARSGSRPEEIAQQQARLQQAEADLAQLAVQIAEGEVRAPARSRVESLAVRPGDLVPPGRIVATLLEEGQTFIRAYVPAPQLPQWQVDAPVEVSLDNAPDRWLSGVIRQINAQAEFLPRNVQTREDRSHQVFGVKVYLQEHPELLKSGISATVRLRP